MTLRELTERWKHRRDEWSSLGVSVDGAKLAAEVLADLEALNIIDADDELTLSDAARESGYSVDHLRHLIAAGQLANAGRKHAPRVRRADLPRKPSALRAVANGARGYDADADAIRLVSGESRP